MWWLVVNVVDVGVQVAVDVCGDFVEVVVGVVVGAGFGWVVVGVLWVVGDVVVDVVGVVVVVGGELKWPSRVYVDVAVVAVSGVG